MCIFKKNKMKKNQDVTLEIAQNMFNIGDLSEITLEYIEDLADPLVDVTLSAIPVVKVVRGIVKFGINIRDRHLLKKTLLFMKQLEKNSENKNFDKKKFEEYKEKVLSNDRNTAEEMERVFVILDKMVEEGKSKFISNAFCSYVNGDIDRSTFFEMITVLDSILIKDLEVVKLLMKGSRFEVNNSQKISLNRLVASGICNNTTFNEIEFRFEDYKLTDLGKLMSWYMIKIGTPLKKKISL